MRVAFVNLPHRQPVVRRYMCTYRLPFFRFPPHELLQLAACARDWNGAEISFLDAIAEECDEARTHDFIARRRADIIVAILGLETVSADLECLERLKKKLPHATTVVFGHYATVFAGVILEKTSVDIVLRGEPEETFSAYLEARAGGREIAAIPGIAGRDAAGAVFVNPERRITDFDRLPHPDYTLVDVRKYEEPFVGGPCGLIYTARGCPATCEFCVRTFGRKLVFKKPETVIEEIKTLMRAGIRVIRFADDTFSFNKTRVIEICRGIVQERLSVSWACLSRLDTLDREMLQWMKKAGCARVIVGIESYSKKVLDYLGKKGDPGKTNEALQLIRDAGIEVSGFLIVGAPGETEEDFQQTLAGIRRAPLDLMTVNILTPFAGTPLFERVKNDIVFSVIPYECRFKDERIGRTALERERRLYRHFYLRPVVFWRQLHKAIRFPYRSLRLLFMIIRPGIVARKTDGRPDLF